MSSGHDWGEVFQDEPRKRIPEGMVLCPLCKGHGDSVTWDNYCYVCHNRGVVTEETAQELREKGQRDE